jgi:hypothetical protein
MDTKYLLNTGKTVKKTSSINLENYQSRLIKEENINLSFLVRDLLELYLTREFPEKYLKLKKEELEGRLEKPEKDEE